MNKRFIQQLAKASFKKNDLDQSTVEKISGYLSKIELREYIRQLKNIDKSNTIFIDLPHSNSAYEKQLHEAFPDKKVKITVDPSLLLGMRVQDNDDVYEMSLKNTLDSMSNFVIEQYD